MKIVWLVTSLLLSAVALAETGMFPPGPGVGSAEFPVAMAQK
jgi:hypothetical protein